MSDATTIMRYLASRHNGNIVNEAVDTLNSFLEDKEHFTIYLYDEDGHHLKLTSKLTAMLVENYEAD